MVARSWHRDWLEDVLNQRPESRPRLGPSSYLCLPLMSIVDIARQCGRRSNDPLSSCLEIHVLFAWKENALLQQKLQINLCFHEFCTHCALYLCSTSTTSVGPPGSIPCPLCRHGIASFIKEIARSTSLSYPFCTCSIEDQEFNSLESTILQARHVLWSSYYPWYGFFPVPQLPKVQSRPPLLGRLRS